LEGRKSIGEVWSRWYFCSTRRRVGDIDVLEEEIGENMGEIDI